MGKEKVHYEAPSPELLPAEMKKFMSWVNLESSLDPVLKAAIAHFWFITIHPFDDGNGRIARAIADLLLSRSDGSSQRFYSMSNQILNQRKAYYSVLERTQRTMLNKLLDNFDGKLTSSKWAKITKCSRDTALNDIKDLMSKDILRKEDAGGRSANYQMVSIDTI